MTQITPYPAYRDTSITWLGHIPAHWEVKRLKWTIAYCQNGAWGDEPNGVDDVACVRVADFDRIKFRVNYPVPTFRALPKAERRNKSLKKGDLLLEKSGGGDLQPVGFIVLYDSDEPAICSNFIARMPVKENYDPNFLCYLHASLYTGKINSQSIKQNTGLQNIDSAAYLNEKVAIPHLPEQRLIAAFLDCQTAKIDALIVKKQRLLKLLAEKRAAMISHAVTKGLNPDAELKDSGVEWLGEIPAHWEVKNLKHFSNVMFSGVDKHSNEDEKTICLCNYVDVYKNEQISSDLDFMRATASFDEIKRFTLKKDDVLITKDSESWNDIAVPAYVPNDLDNILCGYHLALIRPNPNEVDGRFLFRALQAKPINYQFELEATGITRYGIDQYSVVSTIFPIPPLPEQRIIAAFLDRETNKLDVLVVKTQSAIDRLREYRSALISAAVTGKIDVREPSTSPGG